MNNNSDLRIVAFILFEKKWPVVVVEAKVSKLWQLSEDTAQAGSIHNQDSQVPEMVFQPFAESFFPHYLQEEK